MKNKKETIAGIIIIGNEILSGRTQDTNTTSLSIWLNSLGIKVQEVRVIPDIEKIIISTVNELRKKFNYVFTTGGIGPTHAAFATASPIHLPLANRPHTSMQTTVHYPLTRNT